MKNFLICFEIAKRNGGVLYDGTAYRRGFTYSPCNDLWGTPLADFRIGKKGKASRYGKELSNEDRKIFYNVDK